MITDSLLDVARIQSPGFETGREQVDVAAVVTDAVAQVPINALGEPVTVSIASEAARLIRDHALMVEALSQVLDNAAKYSPDGGEIFLSVDSQEGWLRLSVEDHGLGMAESDMRNLFSTFHRIKRAETMNIPGTGLGLYTVRELVERMGGTVEARSKLGEGSKVHALAVGGGYGVPGGVRRALTRARLSPSRSW